MTMTPETPGLVDPNPSSYEDIQERWIDSPVGKVRYFVDKEGEIIQDRRSNDVVTNFRLAKLELGHGQISRQLELNTALTQQVVDILKGTRMLVKVISFMAPITKWAVTVAAGVLFFYALIKGTKPPIPEIHLFEGE